MGFDAYKRLTKNWSRNYLWLWNSIDMTKRTDKSATHEIAMINRFRLNFRIEKYSTITIYINIVSNN